MTILTSFHKEGCCILNKSHLSSNENKPYGCIKKFESRNYSQEMKLKIRSSA